LIQHPCFIGVSFHVHRKTSSRKNQIVFYSHSLAETLAKVTANGGVITQPIFDFPGGQRFHFNDTTGNEFAVWSDQR